MDTQSAPGFPCSCPFVNNQRRAFVLSVNPPGRMMHTEAAGAELLVGISENGGLPVLAAVTQT